MLFVLLRVLGTPKHCSRIWIVLVRGVTTAPQTPQCGGLKGALCCWEKEILELIPKTSLGQWAHMVFSAGGGAEFEVMPLLLVY